MQTQFPGTSQTLLAGVVAARPPFSVVLTVWLSIMVALGVGARPACSRTCSRRTSLLVFLRERGFFHGCGIGVLCELLTATPKVSLPNDSNYDKPQWHTSPQASARSPWLVRLTSLTKPLAGGTTTGTRPPRRARASLAALGLGWAPSSWRS